MRRPFLWLFATLMLCSAVLSACRPGAGSPDARLMVAWVTDGALMLWQGDDDQPRQLVSAEVTRAIIAPDGGHIAYTRQNPASLWVIDRDGQTESQRYQAAGELIGDVAWLDAQTLIFNTLAEGGPAPMPRDDLYQDDIRQSQPERLLAPGDGGRFAISPSGRWIALVSAGVYDSSDGQISVMESQAPHTTRSLMTFPAVATGAHTPFYPSLHWLPDESALLIAIPDADLIYAEASSSGPPVNLWRLPVDPDLAPELLGEVPASFFGLPRWSDDGQWLSYVQRQPTSNRFDSVIANQDGSNAQIITSGDAGTLQAPEWITGSAHFWYAQTQAGQVYVGSPGTAPERPSDALMLTPRFISPDQVVYVTVDDAGRYGLSYRQADGRPQPIVTGLADVPPFDVHLYSDGG